MKYLEALCETISNNRRVRGTKKLTAVDDTRARFIVFLLRAPQILEGAEGCENRSTNPDRVLALRRRNNLHFYTGRRERRQLLLHTVPNTREHGRAPGQHNVAIEVTTDIEVALED